MDEEPKPRVEIDMTESEPEPEDEEEAEILTNHAAGAALDGFMRLAANMAVDRKPMGNVTLEDIVRELMRPMLREWLDVHLPPIIEKVVQKELDKIARKAIDE
jgi:cell pole-organizing protein PopZ